MKVSQVYVTALLAVVIGIMMLAPTAAKAHCDTMSGPVVTAARQAIESGNVNLVLIWVQPKDEAAIREEFDKARTERKAGGQAQEDADIRFFNTFVRIHRAGEGAPFTGIKPAGTDVGPAVPAADRALESGTTIELQKVLGDAVQAGVQKHFQETLERRHYDPNDVSAGRAFVKAYVEYTHYVEGVYESAMAAGHHEHGEGEDPHGAEHGAAHDGHAGYLPWVLVSLLGLVIVGETGWIFARKKRI